jgi:hypothetical protein
MTRAIADREEKGARRKVRPRRKGTGRGHQPLTRRSRNQRGVPGLQTPGPRSGLPRPRLFLEPGVWSLESLPPEGCRGSRPQAPDPRSGLPRPRLFLEPGVWSLESLPPCARFRAEGTIGVRHSALYSSLRRSLGAERSTYVTEYEGGLLSSPSKVTTWRNHCEGACLLCACRRRAAGSYHPYPALWICRFQPASAGFVGVAGSLQGPAGARDILQGGLEEIGHLERAGLLSNPLVGPGASTDRTGDASRLRPSGSARAPGPAR